MKLVSIIALLLSVTSCGTRVRPRRVDPQNVYTNPSNHEGRSYYESPGLIVWDEGGRPYWRNGDATLVKKETSNKASKVRVSDLDNDGVIDTYDRCQNTPRNSKVNAFGCLLSSDVNINLDVRFESAKATLKKDYTKQIDLLADIMKKNNKLRIEIQGHTDNTGSRAFNLSISEKRSLAVKKYLLSKGISEDRIVAKGFGPDKPLKDNSTLAGRKLNRRVEARIIQ